MIICTGWECESEQLQIVEVRVRNYVVCFEPIGPYADDGNPSVG